MSNLASMFFDRNPARNWSDVAARAELVPYTDEDQPMVRIEPAQPFPLVRRKLLPPPFACVPQPTVPVGGQRIEDLGDHLLMRRQSGTWRVIRKVLSPVLAVAALLCAGAAQAEEMSKTIEARWEHVPRSEGQTIAKASVVGVWEFLFVRADVPGGGAIDQLFVRNSKDNTFCTASGSPTTYLQVICGKTDGYIRFGRTDKLEVEWVWQVPDAPAPAPKADPKAPAKPRVLPLPRATVRS